jgi:adenylylsulfate kinase
MRNLFFHKQTVDRNAKETINKHKGCIVWLTGLSGSGKSTIANQLEEMLFRKKVQTIILDGDNIRMGLNSDLGFSKYDRTENIRRIGEVAKLLAENGIIVIAAFISPYRKERNKVRSITRKGDFIEVFVNCDRSTCLQRDPKGLYKKAQKNKLSTFTGISAPYEVPLSPELTLNSSNRSARACANDILRYLINKKKIKGK